MYSTRKGKKKFKGNLQIFDEKLSNKWNALLLPQIVQNRIRYVATGTQCENEDFPRTSNPANFAICTH